MKMALTMPRATAGRMGAMAIMTGAVVAPVTGVVTTAVVPPATPPATPPAAAPAPAPAPPEILEGLNCLFVCYLLFH